MGFIAWIIMGLIAGAIAKSIMKQDGNWVSSLVFGLLGGVVGGWIGDLLPFGSGGRLEFFSLGSWILAIVGATVVLWVYRLITGKSAKA
ncbi:MAG: GlsB/YeaQ/YmgE family stress response membrane protein [Propionicimonas sp.]|uniref:GlsB/YeaQ/YmgE family stress response membrane protein n=1 Tax=Propionicimonas sp. TaxID=1955623 RepID=UPI002B1E96D3|nr:GlsB/YeaQ/YmgE family stress response membrane protein [Propionicimonas sp.]MEA4943195.1 GlsB/YeaQ/YmgE family stress response membrane protein [Propionicimonas sp.]